MRPRVADAADGVGVGQHLADHVQAACCVVLEGVQQQGVTVAVRQQVQRQLPRAHAEVRGAGGNRCARVGLVVGHVAELEGAGERVVHPLAEAVCGPILHQRTTQVLVGAHARGSLRRREVRDLAVRGVVAERVDRDVEPEHHADRPAADLSVRSDACGVGGMNVIEGLPPQLGGIVHLQQQHRQRAARQLCSGSQRLELAGPEVGVHLQHAGVGLPHRLCHRSELGIARRQRRRQAAVGSLVLGGAAGGEPERARFERLGDQLADPLKLGGARQLGVVGTAFAHHEEPQRPVRQLAAHVHHTGSGRERVEIFRVAGPAEVDALGQHGARDVLHALHQIDQVVLGTGLHRGEADAAVAEDRRGHAVPRRRRHLGIPRGLPVVVSVDVHPARQHQVPLGVDLAASPPRHRADLQHRAIAQGHIGCARRAAAPVHHRSVPDHHVSHGAERTEWHRRASERVSRRTGSPRPRRDA